MTFLNATLILGVAAIAVPIVLHLMAKREPRKVVFPSIYFLSQRYESNRSRLRLQRWWLLALRVAAIAALALALAGPVIDRALSTTWLSIALIAGLGIALLAMASVAIARGPNRTIGYTLATAAAMALLSAVLWAGYAFASGPDVALDSAAPVALAIVLDNGPTSAWKTPDDDRNGRMRDLAKGLATRIPRTSRIAIVDRSRQPIAFSLDPASAISKIDQVSPLQVAQPIDSQLENAARLLRTSELTNRQILIVTDLSASTWPEITADRASLSSLSESPPIAVHIFDLGDFDAPNRSLSTVRVADTTPAKGVSVPVSVTLDYQDHSAGPPSAADETRRLSLSVTAELQMYDSDPALPVIRDGAIRRPNLRNVDRTSVQISPNRPQELVLTVPPLDVGTHHGQIRLIGDDAMPLDDIRYFTLQVLPSSSVLLVGDDDATRTIGLTMTVPKLLDDPAAEFLVQRVSSSDLPVVQVDEFDAVVLIDPPRQSLRDDSLVQFVESGGGLLVCLGPAAGDEATRDAAVTNLLRRWRVPSPGTFFEIQQPSHPAVSSLADTAGGVPWNEYRVTQYWQIAPSPRYADTALMTFAGTDHPALLQRRFVSSADDVAESEAGPHRDGRCLVMTTTLPDLRQRGDRWNDLYGSDAWPAFVLVRQMANFITRRSGQGAAGFVGTPHVAEIARARASMTKTTSSRIAENDGGDDVQVDGDAESNETRRLQLFRPGDASPVPVTVQGGADQVVIRDVSTAGTYWLRGNEPGAGFSINLRVDPKALSRIDSSRLDQWFGVDGYNLATRQNEVELTNAASSSRVSLHSPAMLLALIVFLLEQILGNRFYRSRSGGVETSANTSVRPTPSEELGAA